MTAMYPYGRVHPLLFCLCGPIASGKSTICQRLLAADPGLVLSVSTTTRAPRTGEVDGTHYHFVDEAEFQARIDAGKFFEHARIGGNAYGTELETINRARAAGQDVLLDIDVQGVTQLKRMFPQETVVVFVFPPSFEVLQARLVARGTDSAERIQKRLELARQEIAILSDAGFAEYLLINDELDSAVLRARAIVMAERSALCHVQRSELEKIVSLPPGASPNEG